MVHEGVSHPAFTTGAAGRTSAHDAEGTDPLARLVRSRACGRAQLGHLCRLCV